MLDGDYSGIYHLASPEVVTKYDLGVALEKIVRSESELIPIAEKKQLARRPHDVSLDTTKARGIGIKLHTISEGVEIVRKQFENSKS